MTNCTFQVTRVNSVDRGPLKSFSLERTGIDVAKEELVLHILPNNEQLAVPNSAEGIKQLVKRFKKI